MEDLFDARKFTKIYSFSRSLSSSAHPYDNKQCSHSHRHGVCSFIHLEAADSAPANFIINNIYEIRNAHLIEGEAKKGKKHL